ncbi:UDP-N-acetylenolpyruvoylglucosamine reductase [Rhodospirillaceae bacterium LM-1]|nr:UDP-N-acetylenolpyruvoylglucosamine reductase [Rhodospirillaceae bacterium LM-1]
MAAAARKQDRLIDRLPPTRGRLEADAPLGAQTWFGTGGLAEVLFKPDDRDDLAAFLMGVPDDVPVTVIGIGSNVLVRDGGIEGVVIRLGKTFGNAATIGLEVHCGAAALDANVARAAQQAGIAGLEFLVGIPGSIGGAIVMNAGAYGSEIKDVFVSAEAVDMKGAIHVVDGNTLAFGYRRSSAPKNWIFTGAVLRGTPGNPDLIEARMNEIRSTRDEAQPLKTRTGGSTFKNPPGMKAWELIDKAGCRGLKQGGAMVSVKHCNFLINIGNATAADIEDLGEEVRRRVKDVSGIELEWEIRRLGRRAS